MNRQSLYFIEPNNVAIQDEPIPTLAPEQVLVKTIVSAISSGTESLLYRGQFPKDLPIDDTIAALGGTFAYPFKYGYAAVGQVLEVGSQVKLSGGLQPGALVFAFNPHETHFLAEPADLIPLPNTLKPETAVFLPNMETAVSFLMDSQPMIGEQVIVFGQGIVGLLTTALLAAYPLTSLITLDRFPLRRQWSRRLGAHETLDPADTHLITELAGRFQANGGFHGADLTFELSGNPAALDQAIQVTGFNGRIFIGSWYGQKTAQLHLGGRFHRSQMRLISSQVSHISPQWRGRWTKERRLQTSWDNLARLQPARLITHRVPFTDAAQAYRLLDQQPEDAVQLVLIYD